MVANQIHKSAVVVSEKGEKINTVPVKSTSDTTISMAESDSDSNTELVIVWKKRSELMTLFIVVLLQCGFSPLNPFNSI